jgi:hypothetical protein
MSSCHCEDFRLPAVSLFNGDDCNRHEEAFYVHWQLGALARRRVIMKPGMPYGVHASKVLWIAQNERGAHDLLHGTSRGLKNRLDVQQALVCLFLDRRSSKLARSWILTGLTGHEDETSRLHGLAVIGGCRRVLGADCVSTQLVSL